MQDILQYLKLAGEKLDSEIATATGISLAEVRLRVAELSVKGDVILCRSIRFKDGNPIESILCRTSGFIPPAAPGRKPKART
jgi:hypothetical protein